MQVTVVTDQAVAPVDLVYFLLGAGYAPSVALMTGSQSPPAESTADCFLADIEGSGRGPLWLSALTPSCSVVVLRNPNPAFRKQLQESGFRYSFRFPTQLKELSSHLADLDLARRAGQEALFSASFQGEGAHFDSRTRRLQGPASALQLTVTEARALAYLISFAGKPISKERIEAAIGSTGTENSRKTDVLMSTLRARLRIAGISNEIKSVRNVGYMIEGRWHRF